MKTVAARLADLESIAESRLDNAFVADLLRSDDVHRLGKLADLFADKLGELELARRLRVRLMELKEKMKVMRTTTWPRVVQPRQVRRGHGDVPRRRWVSIETLGEGTLQ